MRENHFLGSTLCLLPLLLLLLLPLEGDAAYTWEPLLCYNQSEAETYLNIACQLEAACRFETTGIRDWHTLLAEDLKLFATNPLLDARADFEPEEWRTGRSLVVLDGATHCAVNLENGTLVEPAPMVVRLILDLITKEQHYVFEEGRCVLNWVPVLVPLSKNVTCTCASGKNCITEDASGIFSVVIACLFLTIGMGLVIYNIWLGRRMTSSANNSDDNKYTPLQKNEEEMIGL